MLYLSPSPPPLYVYSLLGSLLGTLKQFFQRGLPATGVCAANWLHDSHDWPQYTSLIASFIVSSD